MNTDTISYGDSGWCYVTKVLNSKTLTIDYQQKVGFLSYEDAELQKKKDEQIFQRGLKKLKISAGMDYTFSSYLNYWFKDILQTYAGGARQSVVAWVLYDLILPEVNQDVFMPRLTSSYIDDLLRRIEPKSKSSGVIAYSVLHCAFRDAFADGILTSNPMDGVKRPKQSLPQIITYKKDHLKILVNAASRCESVYLEILLAMFLGLRTGEILGLKFSDFDIEEHTITIRRQITQEFKVEIMEDGSKHVSRKQRQEKAPKSVDSVRCLRIPEFLLEEVKKRKQQQESKAAVDAKYSDPWLDYVSLGPHGTIKSYNTCRNALRTLCAQNGIPKISMHGLRHVFATLMLEQGVPLEKLSKMLGHKNTATTLDIYCGIISGMESIRTYVSGHLDPVQSLPLEKEVV